LSPDENMAGDHYRQTYTHTHTQSQTQTDATESNYHAALTMMMMMTPALTKTSYEISSATNTGLISS